MYTCPRCNFCTSTLTVFIKHANRKIICKPLNPEVNIEMIKTHASHLIETRNALKTHVCDKCLKKYKTRATLKQHIKNNHPTNFGDENIEKYLDDQGHFMKELILKHKDMSLIFTHIAILIFKKTGTLKVSHDTSILYMVKNDAVTKVQNPKNVLLKAKQKINMIMQHPLALDSAEQFKEAVGTDAFDQLNDWTYEIDLIDEGDRIDVLTDQLLLQCL